MDYLVASLGMSRSRPDRNIDVDATARRMSTLHCEKSATGGTISSCLVLIELSILLLRVGAVERHHAYGPGFLEKNKLWFAWTSGSASRA